MSSDSESEDGKDAPQAEPAYVWSKITSAQEAQLKVIYGSFEDGSSLPWEVRSALGGDASALQDNQREFFLDPANPPSTKDAKASFDALADILKASLKKQWKDHLKKKDPKEAYADASARMTKEIALLTAPPQAPTPTPAEATKPDESAGKRGLETKAEPPAKKPTPNPEAAAAADKPKPTPKPEQSAPVPPRPQARVPVDLEEVLRKESEEKARKQFAELTGGATGAARPSRPAPLSSVTYASAGSVRNAEAIIRRLETTKY